MKKWYQIIASLLVSIVVWLVLNLSQETTEVVSLQVRAVSDIPGHARYANDVSVVTALVRASGFKLLALRRNNDYIDVEISSADLTQENVKNLYSISSNRLYKYVSSIYGAEVTVESFITQKAFYLFHEENCIKLPVKVNTDIKFANQYISTSSLSVEPDSVLVYGDPSRLSSLESVQTSVISLSQVKSDCHGSIGLKTPAGMRLSQQKVTYSLPVTRYVQINANLPIEVVGAPEGTEILVYPSSADVAFNCNFPVVTDPSTMVRCVVDYDDFASSLGGKCVVKCLDIPLGVISYSVTPEYCGCVESIQLK